MFFFVLFISSYNTKGLYQKTYGSNSWMTLSNRNTENNLVENAVEEKKNTLKQKHNKSQLKS